MHTRYHNKLVIAPTCQHCQQSSTAPQLRTWPLHGHPPRHCSACQAVAAETAAALQTLCERRSSNHAAAAQRAAGRRHRGSGSRRQDRRCRRAAPWLRLPSRAWTPSTALSSWSRSSGRSWMSCCTARCSARRWCAAQSSPRGRNSSLRGCSSSPSPGRPLPPRACPR